MNGLGNGSNLQDIGISFVISIRSNYTPLSLMLLVASIIIIPPVITQSSSAQLPVQKKKVVLTAIIVQLHTNRDIGKTLLDRALTNLKMMNPNLDIKLNYLEYPYNQLQSQLLKMMNDTTTTTITTTTAYGSVDLISLDQIWLGEFAQKGLLTDLTNYTKNWGRQNDWYDENWNGGIYGGKVYGIWAWTDIREYGTGKIFWTRQVSIQIP
ncbi:MAG TPA: extracellular solute-binding protein [Nitrososphaeraceae archaeon]|jgi:multiple sugar transport system substrate-binding protein